MPRQLDAELVGVVEHFRHRRKWRHIVAIFVGAIMLVLGTGLVAAHVAHHGTGKTPALGEGIGLYAVGVLLFAWGAARGFTRQLAKWLPASIVLGLVAVIVFLLAALLSNDADVVFSNGRPQGGSTWRPAPPRRSPTGSIASSRVLAAELLDELDVEQLLGSTPATLETPGAAFARSRSLAIWRASAAAQLPTAARAALSTHAPAVSLTVQESARQARKIRSRGSRGGIAIAAIGDGGYVRHHSGSLGAVTRVRACRGRWVVALQLRTDAATDRTGELADNVSHLLTLLNAASNQ